MKFKEFLKEESIDQHIERLKETYSLIRINKQSTGAAASFSWEASDHESSDLKPYKYGKHQVYDEKTGEVFTTLNGLFGEDGKINTDYEHIGALTVNLKSGKTANIGEDFPGLIRVDTIRVMGEYANPGVIDGFANWPNVEGYLDLNQCKIESLAGVEKFSLEEIEFRLINTDDLNCGLLRLLKCPHLISIEASSLRGSEKELDDLDDAFNILEKHLKSKDITECMDELIEAGFKKYAKT